MLDGLMEIIRGHLGNDGFHRHSLETFHHANACAAARALEDAELAIAHYLENDSSGEPGIEYLRTYGVLQAAYLQQDAAKLLRGAFGLPKDLPQSMADLRELRNRTGHPADTPEENRKRVTAKRKRKSDPPATFLVRCEMSSCSLALLKVAADGTWHSSSVDLRVMLKEQGEALRGWLEELVDELQRREKERREEIAAGGLMSALMPSWWRYALQKIQEASVAPDAMSARLAQTDASSLLNMLESVEADLRERDINPPHSRTIETARAALDRLSELLHRAASGEAVQLDIDAFATLADRHLTDIAEFLQETDERLKNS
jgi:hypothetical protein